MQRIFASILAMALFTLSATSQVPQAFNYQAIARNAAGQTLPFTPICMRFSILDGVNPGHLDYQETFSNLSTNQFGLFVCAIGEGVATFGLFDTIHWSTGNKYLSVEMDVNCTGAYTQLGAYQLLSVPYALYAANSASVEPDSTLWLHGTGTLPGIGTSDIYYNQGNAALTNGHNLELYNSSNTQWAAMSLDSTNYLLETNPIRVTNGDVYINNSSYGVIMQSPNGQCWRVTVSNAGSLVSTSITCP